jgi:hypothetical protein
LASIFAWLILILH